MASLIKKYARGKKKVSLEYFFGFVPKKFKKEGDEDWRINEKLEYFANDNIEIYGEINGEDFTVYVGVNKRKYKFDDR